MATTPDPAAAPSPAKIPGSAITYRQKLDSVYDLNEDETWFCRGLPEANRERFRLYLIGCKLALHGATPVHECAQTSLRLYHCITDKQTGNVIPLDDLLEEWNAAEAGKETNVPGHIERGRTNRDPRLIPANHKLSKTLKEYKKSLPEGEQVDFERYVIGRKVVGALRKQKCKCTAMLTKGNNH
jgi:hypothetical protein